MSTKECKKLFYKNESKFLKKGCTVLAYVSPNTIEYVVKKLGKLSKRKLQYYLHNKCEDDCWVIKPLEQ